jgi:large subunit ribosomal protein L17
MRHGDKNNNLSRTASHRKALLMNLGCQLITYKRITTTLAKAKALRTYIEPLITKTKSTASKEAIMHNHRIVFSYLNDKAAVKELFTVVAPKVAGRPGGYTRIIKLGARVGDNAEIAMIELVDFNEVYTNGTQKSAAEPTKKTRRSGGAKKATTEGTSTQPKAVKEPKVAKSAITDIAAETITTAEVVEVAPTVVEKEVIETVEAAPIVTETVTETVVVDAAASTTATTDDLTIIEGLGPKAAEVLIAGGISTFLQLVNTPADKVKEILTSANARVGHLDPTTWGQQAQLAADGKMDELKALQDKLNNGKEA